jgi:hypothetical protein
VTTREAAAIYERLGQPVPAALAEAKVRFGSGGARVQNPQAVGTRRPDIGAGAAAAVHAPGWIPWIE